MIDENLIGLLVFLTDFSSEVSRSSFKFHFSSLAPPYSLWLQGTFKWEYDLYVN